jgi:hypothetical protein
MCPKTQACAVAPSIPNRVFLIRILLIMQRVSTEPLGQIPPLLNPELESNNT